MEVKPVGARGPFGSQRPMKKLPWPCVLTLVWLCAKLQFKLCKYGSHCDDVFAWQGVGSEGERHGRVVDRVNFWLRHESALCLWSTPSRFSAAFIRKQEPVNMAAPYFS